MRCQNLQECTFIYVWEKRDIIIKYEASDKGCFNAWERLRLSLSILSYDATF